MSASLVGSEMCIRDRAKALAGVWKTWNGYDSRWAQPSWIATVGECPAVSYTHLTLPTICSV
eukprot:8599067-Alexandrium_andersonii.AAC.1